MKKNANKGFSLVELIIVIAIMAVLIGVLAPQFIKQVEKSRESTDLQNIEEVKTAVEVYVADHSDDITEATIVVTGTKGGNITVTGADLDEYGVDEKPMKSSKWSASIVWTYTLSDYTWGLTGTPHADYYDANGNSKPSTGWGS